jgi:DNA (cytosine-5)-methyltransferase 1
MTAYYNEIDPYAAQWLRNLIAAGHIAPGVVDERSIQDITPNELEQYTQCHFFAGIGIWSLALRRAGWPDERPVWAGSCPCQPFSAAGAGAGFDDERHLWPDWFHLIDQCRPSAIFGEQVEAAIRHSWLDLIQTDLEAIGYACGAVGFPAAGVGAPHIRQRLYWMGNSGCERLPKQRGRRDESERCAETDRLSRVADSDSKRPNGQHSLLQRQAPGWHKQDLLQIARDYETSGCWSPSPIIGNWPVEPGTFPLAHGATSRVGRLRAYGNAIVPQQAEAFIRAYLDARTMG